MAIRNASETEDLREEQEPGVLEQPAGVASNDGQVVPVARPQYITRQTDREGSVPSAEMPREQKRGLLARLRFGAEMNEHELTMMRGTHLVIEGQAHAEGAAVTAIRGVQLRGQMADRIGNIVQGFGPDSAAYGVMPGIAQEGFEEGDEAISSINRQTYESLKRNQRMIK